MSVNPDQMQQAIQAIEAQLAILKQAVGQPVVDQTPGVVGIFDGEYMVTEDGKRYQVPPNYASKSMLVPGDTIKMVEDPAGGMAKFKQTVKAERLKTTGLLARKDGKFEVLSEEGSFKVLSAAIKHFEGEPGDSVTIQYPKQHVKGSYAAVEKVVKAGAATTTPAVDPAPVAAGVVEQLAATSGEAVIQAEVTSQAPTKPTVTAAPSETKSPPPTPKPAPNLVQAAPATIQHTPKAAPEARQKPAPKPAPKPAAPRPNPAPKPANKPVQPAAQATADKPKPVPAPQEITPGAMGEISVAQVMDEDDLT